MLTYEDLLRKEKLSLLRHINSKNRTFHRDGCPIPKKDAKVSTELRKQGNVVYTQFRNDTNFYLDDLHIGAWNIYTKSIMYAPNDSEQLALGYGNRSAIMFYLCAFEDCIVECDRAISITSSNCLKFKLLCRKAESLCHLDRCAKEECNKALQLLDSLNLDATKKKNYEQQLHLWIVANHSIAIKSKKRKKKNYADALKNFERSQEVPCASKSVAVQYNKKWGRHIVATEDIPAGKIIAVEEEFFSCSYNYLNYLYCNNCKKYLLLHNSVPCEHCVYNIYCSESCRKEAWDKYHQFQCPITPFLNFMESIKGSSESSLKFILPAIHQVGGIEQMKQQLLEIENVDDPRMKGFSGGIFQHDKLVNIFCLDKPKEENVEDEARLRYLENSCLCAYLLAKHTDFFGEKMNMSETEVFLNEDILFIASLLLRYYHISHTNMNTVMAEDKLGALSYYAPFGSLFNHSCDPNVQQLVDSRIVYFTRCPVQKGSQLFLAYNYNTFDNKDKESRQKDLQKKYFFTCKCIACTENWSSICLPSLKHVLEIVPSLKNSVPTDTDIILEKALCKYGFLTEFKPKVAKKILCNIKLLSKNFTVHCKEYAELLGYLNLLYAAAFFDNGVNNFQVPVCESTFQV